MSRSCACANKKRLPVFSDSDEVEAIASIDAIDYSIDAEGIYAAILVIASRVSYRFQFVRD